MTGNLSGLRILISVLLGTLAGVIAIMFGAEALIAVMLGAAVGSLGLCILYLRSGVNARI